MLIPIDVNKVKDTGSLWGVIAEEVSHIQDGLEGRQDKKVAEDETNKEKGLESLGRPINDYVKNKLGDDNSSDIQLSTDGIDLTNADVGEKVGDYFPKQEIDAAGGVKKVFGWDPDKGITLTETGHFLTGFSEAILADMLLNPNLIQEKYKYRSLAYKYGELTGHSTMIGVGCIGSVSGECLQGVGAAGGTAGASLGISWVGVGVETYSLGLTTVSTINAAKTNSQISAMKAVGSSGSGGTNNSGNTNLNQIIENNFNSLTDDEKITFEKYEKNGWKGQYGKNGPSHAGGDFDNTGEGGGQILPKYEADGTPIEYKEYDINNVKPRDNKRFVRGSDGSVYYTDDHYMTFRRIK